MWPPHVNSQAAHQQWLPQCVQQLGMLLQNAHHFRTLWSFVHMRSTHSRSKTIYPLPFSLKPDSHGWRGTKRTSEPQYFHCLVALQGVGPKGRIAEKSNHASLLHQD